uniref:Uncharacterized protein n=1 Tax=Plectus sambesii TaxID=2011161 RepID=A0A914VB70_9BILA
MEEDGTEGDEDGVIVEEDGIGLDEEAVIVEDDEGKVEVAIEDDVGGVTVVEGGGGGINPQIAAFNWAAKKLSVGRTPKSVANVLLAPDASEESMVWLAEGPIPTTMIVWLLFFN